MLISAITPFAVFAKNQTITKSIDFATINKDYSGPGFVWKNIEGTLTIDGLNIDTTDQYGINLPEESTIIIKGSNYIKASTYAVRSLSSLNFEGDGTLTVISDDIGVISISQSTSNIIRFRSGNVNITAPYGVFSENCTISFSGGNVTVNSSSYSISGNNVQMTSGNLNITGRISAKKNLSVSAVNLTASASEAVLTAGEKLKIQTVDISVGETLENLNSSDKYNGEKAVKLVSTAVVKKPSILFGGKAPAFVDYLVFVSLIAFAGAVIAIPLYIKHKKTKKLLAEYEKIQAEREKKFGKKKKNSKK